MENTGIINIILILLVWIGIIVFFAKLFRSQDEKPKVWKALIVLLVGMFSFSIDFMFLDTFFQFPLLPLGVMGLYLAFSNRKDRWNVYRPYAWVGFMALFIFLIANIITVPIQNLVYPKDQLNTYISDVEDASIILTHPSGEEVGLDTQVFEGALDGMKRESFNSIEWYNSISGFEGEEQDELFPYVLNGTSPKWGSGVEGIIYIESDGKGLLVTTQGEQYYFRSNDSLIKEGVDE